LDAALSKSDLYRDQVAYLQGVLDAKKGGSQAAAQTPPQTDKPAETSDKDQGAGQVDEIDTAITAAEQRKLDLAGRYDEGEISAVEWKKQEQTIDKEIRDLSNKRFDKFREESRAEAQNAVAANNFEAVKENLGVNLGAKHPNVAVIDSMSPLVSKGVWEAITDQASKNLAAQGIKVSKENPSSQLMLIQEKARLTDNLDAFIPGFKTPAAAQQPASGGQPAQRKPSETALNRQAKIELANSQPPSIADMGTGAGNAELTEADIEKMTDDQVADLLAKAPNLVNKIMGTHNRG
jgi:hypothetical protein